VTGDRTLPLARHDTHDFGGILPAGAWATLFVQAVRERSSVCARIWQEYGDRAAPEILLYRNGDPKHFAVTTGRKVGCPSVRRWHEHARLNP
jgi:hypothetical protein